MIPALSLTYCRILANFCITSKMLMKVNCNTSKSLSLTNSSKPSSANPQISSSEKLVKFKFKAWNTSWPFKSLILNWGAYSQQKSRHTPWRSQKLNHPWRQQPMSEWSEDCKLSCNLLNVQDTNTKSVHKRCYQSQFKMNPHSFIEALW